MFETFDLFTYSVVTQYFDIVHRNVHGVCFDLANKTHTDYLTRSGLVNVFGLGFHNIASVLYGSGYAAAERPKVVVHCSCGAWVCSARVGRQAGR